MAAFGGNTWSLIKNRVAMHQKPFPFPGGKAGYSLALRRRSGREPRFEVKSRAKRFLGCQFAHKKILSLSVWNGGGSEK
jgi:hypothetical protein